MGYIFQNVLNQKGVLDIYQTPIYMKKNRPGVLLTLLVETDYQEDLENYLLVNTSTFGVRTYPSQRKILQRKFLTLADDNFNFSVKVGIMNNKVIKITPEYEDLRAISELENLPIRDVYNKANFIIEKYKESAESE